MKNILVIGGSYFVGRVFVEELWKDKEYSIHVLNRGTIPVRKEGVNEIVCDRHNPELVREKLPSLEWYGIVDFCAYNAADIRGIFSALPKDAVQQYIYISTASVYAKSHNFPIKEDEPKLSGPQPELGHFSDYGYNKWLAERELQKQCAEMGVHHTSVRPAFIYGKYNYAPRESYFFDRIIQNETVVIPDNDLALFSFVSVWDVARIIMGCLGNNRMFNRAINASADELISYGRLIKVLQIITQKEFKVKMMAVDQIKAQQIPLPFPLDEHLIYSGALSQNILGFQYTTFLEGMSETYRYYLIGRGLK